MNNQSAGRDGGTPEVGLVGSGTAGDEAGLLAELRSAWGMPLAGPFVVVGRLTLIRSADNRTLHFLQDIEHPESGVGLFYPEIDSPASAFVPPQVMGSVDVSDRPWVIAELELSPAKEREKRSNRHACMVRRGSLRLLRDVPVDWQIAISGRESVRRISDAAFQVLRDRHQQRLEALESEIDQLNDEREEGQRRLDGVRTLAQIESLRAADDWQRHIDEIEHMKERLHRLSDLVSEKGQRLTALGLLDGSDLQALLPPVGVNQVEPAHDFDALLGSAFDRLAPYLQARMWHLGLRYTQAQLRDFLAVLRTHDVMVLAGDSGAGKTSLVRAVAESLGGRCTVIPVKPNWTGPEDLLGYFNPIERRFQPTPFLLALQAAEAAPEVPHFICLDEMNLARVEHYFADFLSLLETRNGAPEIPLYAADEERHAVTETSLFLTLEKEVRQRVGLADDSSMEDLLVHDEANALLHRLGGFKDAESVLRHHARLRRSLAAVTRTPTTLRLPPNIRILGTVNVDETTHYLSPKVLDRVHVLRLRNPVLVNWSEVEAQLPDFDGVDMKMPVRLSTEALGLRTDYPPFNPDDPDVDFLIELVREHLEPLGVEFGMRAIRQAQHYLHHAGVAGIGPQAAMNNVLLHKVLPKLMLDLGRRTRGGRARSDVLNDLAAVVTARMDGLDAADVPELCSEALDQLIAAAEHNNGIANYWTR